MKTKKSVKRQAKAAKREKVKPAADRISFQALPLNQNRHRFYFSTIPIDDLFPCCFVSRREDDPAKGFQRSLNESRSDDIAKYLVRGDGSIPTNIVLSAQPNAGIKWINKAKLISFNSVEKSFLVLDGQHRLWGYQKCKKNHRVPVAIYENLTRAEEAKLFIDINTTQRGVPAALLLDIKQVAEIETHIEQNLRSIFDKINSDSKSPLNGKMSRTASKPGMISRVTFNKSLKSLFALPIISDLESKDQYQLIRNFLNAFDSELEEKKLLVRSAFFEAIFDLFDEIIRESYTRYNNVKQESLQEIIKPIAKLDYTTVSSSGTKVTKSSYEHIMRSALRKRVQISGEML